MKRIIVLLFLFFSFSLQALDYKVEFQGVKERTILSQLKEASATAELRNKKPINSLAHLRKRAEADLVRLQDVLRYYGYLDATVDFVIERGEVPTCVFRVDRGVQYQVTEITTSPQVDFSGIDVTLPTPAETEKVQAIEEHILQGLRKKGFAFVKIAKKELIADQNTHQVELQLSIDTGPAVTFGKTEIKGLESIKPWRVRKHIFWREGDAYDPEKIAKTQESLEKSNLFSSVVIHEESEQLLGDALPIDIRLQEAKHKSIGAGLSYTTAKGAGCMGEWEHRNVQGRGDKFTIHTELWQKFQLARMTLKQPHFKKYNQDRIWLIEFDRQKTLPFFSQAVSGACLIERKWSERVETYWGGKVENLFSRSAEGNHTYQLVKLPLMLKCSSAKNLLDPLNGLALHTKVTPSYQFLEPNFFYLSHVSTLIAYCPILEESMTFALKGTLGNIFGAARHTIPTPDRLFSGTENTLRGYRYLSVSPLNRHNVPIGGRSLLAGSAELRMRLNSGLGGVLFYDVGNVYSTTFPDINKKMLHSVGFGARYMTSIGPIRLDVAFPMHRRKNIDPAFQVYFSIGQAF